MFWVVYIIHSIVLSLIIARVSKKYSIELFILLLIIFITPAQIEVSVEDYAPSLFTFMLNVIFLEDFSTRVLRPLFLSVPSALFAIFLYSFLKRKFF